MKRVFVQEKNSNLEYEFIIDSEFLDVPWVASHSPFTGQAGDGDLYGGDRRLGWAKP
jgi:hypothetical protein